MLQWLNVVLIVLKISKTSLVNEIIQLLGRSVFAYASLNYTDGPGSPLPFVFLAFFAFGIVESTRYPYYFLKIVDLENTSIGKLMGHCRYNLFIVLYPLGAFSDYMAGLYACKTMESSGAFILSMPNSVNFGISLPFLIRYVFSLAYLAGFPQNYSLLFRQRAKYYKQMAEVGEKKDN